MYFFMFLQKPPSETEQQPGSVGGEGPLAGGGLGQACMDCALSYSEQPGLHFPPEQSVLQHQLADLLEFTQQNKMKINMKKTKVIPFHLSKKYDFLPHNKTTWCHTLQ